MTGPPSRTGFAAVAAAALPSLPLAGTTTAARIVTLPYRGRIYRSDGSGRIRVSSDGGPSCALHSDLGDDNSVTGLAVDRYGRLDATIRHARWDFDLVLAPDQAAWLTT